MSVLIKGMKMPKECADCYIRERDTCPLLKANVSGWGRMGNCPLIELPDHGRLIDADALDTSILQEGFSYALTRRKLRYTAGDMRQKIVYAPTVIPAERSEE